MGDLAYVITARSEDGLVYWGQMGWGAHLTMADVFPSHVEAAAFSGIVKDREEFAKERYAHGIHPIAVPWNSIYKARIDMLKALDEEPEMPEPEGVCPCCGGAR